MTRTTKTLAVLLWLNLICSWPHKTAASHPEFRSELRDYNLSKPLTIKTDTIPELLYKTPPFDLNGHNANWYDWGNCTFGVASWINIPNNLGNAQDWGVNAVTQAKPVSDVPQVGAVAFTTRGQFGHVGLVVGVEGNMVQLHEENVIGLGVVDTHWYPTSDYSYIYF